MKEIWKHDEQRDGAGCSWCGDYAQVNEDCLCVECFDEPGSDDEPDVHELLGILQKTA